MPPKRKCARSGNVSVDEASLTRRALADLDAIERYLSAQSVSGAAKVGATIRRATESIETFPQGGKLADLENVRVMPAGGYPYLIYWEVHLNEVRVLDIRHASRMPWSGQGQ